MQRSLDDGLHQLVMSPGFQALPRLPGVGLGAEEIVLMDVRGRLARAPAKYLTPPIGPLNMSLIMPVRTTSQRTVSYAGSNPRQ